MSLASYQIAQKFTCALSSLAVTAGIFLFASTTPAKAEAPATPPATTSEWIQHAQARLNDTIHYPWFAMRNEDQGLVRLSATVMPDGRLQDVSIARSAGIRALDRAALRAIEKLEPLPPLPGATSPRQVVLQVGFGVARSPLEEAKLAQHFREAPATAFAEAKRPKP